MKFNKLSIFDLDGTVVDSSHRYKALPNGDIDLPHWRANCTPEQIAKDSVLPLAEYMRSAFRDYGHIVAICTSRVLQEADLLFLEKHDLQYHFMLSRGASDSSECCTMKRKKILELANTLNIPSHKYNRIQVFEDHPGVIVMVEKLGMIALHAPSWNKRLANNG